MSGQLIRIDDFVSFSEVRDVDAAQITLEHLRVVKSLDEREELEPYLRAILHDPNETPHGPAELVDIFTHRVELRNTSGMAAFILKGRSFPTVKPKDVSHQIYRLEKIADLKIAIFAAPGTILDMAKEQFCATAARLQCAYSIFDATDLSRLFIAYGFLCPRDAKKIVSGRCNCGYSPRNRLLNLFQKEALSALAQAHKRHEPEGLVILPPGSGKTRIAAEDAKSVAAKQILYIAHTAEILDIAQSEFEAKFSKDAVTRHSSRDTLSRLNIVNLATVQLVHRNRDRGNLASVDYLVVDEFHHAAATSYRAVLAKCRPKFLLGLTATPFRGDRQDIFELCGQNVLANFELRAGIDSGILSPYHYYGCFDDVDYTKIKHNGHAYDARDLERALVIPQRQEAIASKWIELAKDKSTIAFCCSQEHASRTAQSFNKSGISAAVYIAMTSTADRRMLLQQLANGEIKILCAVDVLNEGADVAFVECLLFLRPTDSKRIFYQQLGRGLRQYAGKSFCTVIDFIGNFKNAYKIVEYNTLSSSEDEQSIPDLRRARSWRDVLNLPLHCKVQFDQKIIDVFSSQALDPRNATRHTIGRILLYDFEKLERHLGHLPTSKEVDRYSQLHSDFYVQVFGSWSAFQSVYSKLA